MTSVDYMRNKRIEFRKSKEHELVENESLIPSSEDKTVLFNTAGVQPLVPYLNWKPHKYWKRLFNIQRCIRTWDIEEVWDERHLTFFEMMWNRSLWDYFKEKSLVRSIEFLIEYAWLEREKLGCSIFWWMKDKEWNYILPYDIESENILLEAGIPKERIKAIPKEKWKKCDNWRIWGDSWPCGPSAEFHYDRGDQRWPNDWNIWENDRFIEIWNNVFMTFYQDSDWTITSLKNKNIDTWMWFERLIMVKNESETLFETDLFLPIINYIESISATNYPPIRKRHHDLSQTELLTTKSFRIIADHIRSVSFLIMDGIIPSNESRWYVCRRLIRRLYYHLSKLYHNKKDIHNEEVLQKIISDIINILIEQYGWAYNWLVKEKSNIIHTLIKEISNFQKTIKNWKKLLDEYIDNSKNNKIDGEFAFKLYDTYGFPIELTQEISVELWLDLDIDWFHHHMSQAKELAKKWSKQKFNKDIDWASYLEWVQATQFIWWDHTELAHMNVLKDFTVEDQRIIIFDKTPFYWESWGQTWDSWTLKTNNWDLLTITNVIKYNWVHLHFIE